MEKKKKRKKEREKKKGEKETQAALMSQGYLAAIREWLSTRCLYMQSAHVDYLQTVSFPLLKPALGALQIPAQRITPLRSSFFLFSFIHHCPPPTHKPCLLLLHHSPPLAFIQHLH